MGLFQQAIGFACGLTSSYVVACTPSTSQMMALETASNLASPFGTQASNAAKMTAMCSGIILSSAKDLLQGVNSNSVTTLSNVETIEQVDCSPLTLVNYVAKQRMLAYVSGVAFGFCFSNIMKSNNMAAIVIMGGASLKSDKKSLCLTFAGIAVTKLALFMCTGLASPISAFALGLFFIPGQINNLLFGKEKVRTSENIGTTNNAFDINSIVDVFNVNAPGASPGGALIVTDLIEGLGTGAMLASSVSIDTGMIGKATVQAIMPSFNTTLAAIGGLGFIASIPLLKSVTSNVLKWNSANPIVLNVIGLTINLATIFMTTPPFLTLGLIGAGLLMSKVFTPSIRRLMFLGGLM